MNTNLKAILLFLIVFLAGVAFGGAITYLILKSPTVTEQAGRSEHGRQAFIEKLRQELGIDDAQHQQILDILNSAREKFRAEDARSRETTDRLRLETRQQIMTILRPDQQEKFTTMLDKFHKESHRRRERHDDDSSKPEAPESDSDSRSPE